jgi:hypothetical protein
VFRHARIDHGERQAMLARQHTDRGTTSQEVLDHLPGDVAGVGGDTFGGQAVVGCEDHHLRLHQGWRLALQDLAKLQGQGFDATQGAQGLGLVVDEVMQALGERGRLQVGQGRGKNGCG